MNKLHALADLFDTLAIDPDDTDVSFSLYSPKRLSLSVFLGDHDSQEQRVKYRRLKRYFSPLKAEGEPPWVDLKGTRTFGEIEVTFRISGAFKCEVKGYTDKVIPAQDAVEAKPERTERVPEYGCRAVTYVDTDEVDAEINGGLPEPDPGSSSNYTPEV